MSSVTRQLLKNRTFVYLLAGVVLMHLASYLITPLFPVFLEKILSFSIGRIGLILGAGSVAFQAASLLAGVLSDRIGGRATMTLGGILQGLAMVGYSFGSNFPVTFLFSVLSGTGLGLYAPAVKAMIAHVTGEQHRTTAFSLRGIAANAGIIVAGLMISLFAISADRQIFYAAAAVYFLLALLTWFTLPPERHRGDHSPIPLSEYREILRHRSFLLFSAVSLLIWALYAQFAMVLPLRGEHVLGSAATVGFIFTINSVMVVLFQAPISRFVLERINPYLSLVIGTLLFGGGLTLLGWSTQFVSLSLSAVLFITGEMMILPVMDSLTGYFAKEKWMGAYYGIANVVSGIGSGIGTAVGGQMVERLGGVGNSLPWVGYGISTAVIVSVLGLYSYYAAERHRKGRPGSEDFVRAKRKEKAR